MSPMVKLPGLDCGLCGCKTCREFARVLAKEPREIVRCIPLGRSARREKKGRTLWRDSLDRPFDFLLDKYPGETGLRETILPHNPMLTRELKIRPGDMIIGRALGCGSAAVQGGRVLSADPKTGVICRTLCESSGARAAKDIGFYIPQAYEGIVSESRVKLQVGMRHHFMLRGSSPAWRRQGLVNFLNRTPDGLQARLEGLFLG